jgi:uncharacterized protein YuzE
MAEIQVKVYYDTVGNTLTVWWGNPENAVISEETGEEMVLMKDQEGRVIGFEKWNVTSHPGAARVQFEALTGIEA